MRLFGARGRLDSVYCSDFGLLEETDKRASKGSVFWELSGWAPKYFPDSVIRDAKGRLKEKVMFGSDYPNIPYERLFREWGELGFSEDVMEGIFHRTAERVLGL